MFIDFHTLFEYGFNRFIKSESVYNAFNRLGVVRSATAVFTWHVSISGQKTASFKSQRLRQMITKEWIRHLYPGVGKAVIFALLVLVIGWQVFYIYKHCDLDSLCVAVKMYS